jgi:hypothetical protein
MGYGAAYDSAAWRIAPDTLVEMPRPWATPSLPVPYNPGAGENMKRPPGKR